MACKYDIIGITDIDEQEESKNQNAVGSSPYVPKIIAALNHFNKIEDDTRDPMPVEQAVKSKSLLSIDLEVYINNQRLHAILCITDNVLIMLYKGKGHNIVMPSIKVNDIQALVLAESMPSAAALHFSENIEEKVHRSHLVFESPNLGLLMRYLLEKDYTTEIDFCNEVTIREGELSATWFFNDMQKWRNQERDDFSNGVLRSVFNCKMLEVEENTFSTNIWHERYAVISNFGIVIF